MSEQEQTEQVEQSNEQPEVSLVEKIEAMLKAGEAPSEAQEEAPAPQATPVEPEPVKEEPVQDKFAHKFSALAKREQKLLEEREAIKAAQEKLSQESARTAKLAQALEMLNKDPIGALETLGIDPATMYADMTEQSLRGSLGPKKAPVDEEAVLEKVRGEINTLKKEFYETQLEQERAYAIEQAKEVVNADPDRYAHIKANGVEDAVWYAIETHQANTGEVLDFQDAADLVESYLEQQAQAIIEAANRKQQRKQAQAPTQKPQEKTVAAPPQTLTNSMSVKTPPSSEEDWLSNEYDFSKRIKYITEKLEKSGT